METQKGKTLLVSYNQVEGFPQGKYEDEKIIILSAHSGGQVLNGRWVKDDSIEWGEENAVARRKVEGIEKMLSEAQSSEISQAVVYVGARAIQGALKIAKHLSSQGKKIRIVGCDCNCGIKSRVARELGLPYEICECGGVRIMGRIAREYQAVELIA
ncbi:MAG: hypothetical protein ABH840_02245 [Nanoarchaeota archaeon]